MLYRNFLRFKTDMLGQQILCVFYLHFKVSKVDATKSCKHILTTT